MLPIFIYPEYLKKRQPILPVPWFKKHYLRLPMSQHPIPINAYNIARMFHDLKKENMTLRGELAQLQQETEDIKQECEALKKYLGQMKKGLLRLAEEVYVENSVGEEDIDLE